MALTSEQREFIEAWVAELESGNRQQTTGRLHVTTKDHGDSFCCLGVACDMAKDRGLVERTSDVVQGTVRYNGLYTVLPDAVMDALGFDDFEGLFDFGSLSTELKDEIYRQAGPRFWRERDSDSTLVDLNDSGVSFATIAKVIREVWLS